MSRRGIWHPWRHLARHHPHLTVLFADLPSGLLGFTHLADGVIVLDRRLSQVERRCTLTHELEHVHRGPVPADRRLAAREERVVDELAARRLVSLRELMEALLWSDNEHEVADELWVDVPTLRTRIAELAAEEQVAIDARLADAPRWQP
ncbi:ImmA/IrrE family metallo-endopeptidase [Geodermatophilus chilensis]|uniref:ImmA/IrrE family metallo-endopeptidase n=1 Tax=Geodermatophilus chilensis TaxID=2035835 RepID=UPI000D526755|nr:ImmA/IrrE family metallo-endopeptidase [Geodermatophilus chilensis]